MNSFGRSSPRIATKLAPSSLAESSVPGRVGTSSAAVSELRPVIATLKHRCDCRRAAGIKPGENSEAANLRVSVPSTGFLQIGLGSLNRPTFAYFRGPQIIDDIADGLSGLGEVAAYSDDELVSAIDPSTMRMIDGLARAGLHGIGASNVGKKIDPKNNPLNTVPTPSAKKSRTAYPEGLGTWYVYKGNAASKFEKKWYAQSANSADMYEFATAPRDEDITMTVGKPPAPIREEDNPKPTTSIAPPTILPPAPIVPTPVKPSPVTIIPDESGGKPPAPILPPSSVQPSQFVPSSPGQTLVTLAPMTAPPSYQAPASITTTQTGDTSSSASSMPSWLIPVGLGLAAVLLLRRKRGGKS